MLNFFRNVQNFLNFLNNFLNFFQLFLQFFLWKGEKPRVFCHFTGEIGSFSFEMSGRASIIPCIWAIRPVCTVARATCMYVGPIRWDITWSRPFTYVCFTRSRVFYYWGLGIPPLGGISTYVRQIPFVIGPHACRLLDLNWANKVSEVGYLSRFVLKKGRKYSFDLKKISHFTRAMHRAVLARYQVYLGHWYRQ